MTSSTVTDRTAARAPHVRNWLALAAAPTFAFMAWVEAGGMATLCSPGAGIGSMSMMYLLMSLFHLPAWLRRGPHGSRTNRQPTTEGD